MHRIRLQRVAYGLGLTMIAIAVVTMTACGGRRSEQAREQGDIHLRLGQYSQARDAYARALESDPANARAHAGLGRTERASGNNDAALGHFDDALAADSTLVIAHVEKAYTLDSLGRPEDALTAARTLASVDEEQGIILEANLLNRRDRAQDARSLLEEATGRLDDSESLRMVLAFTYANLRDFSGAERELRRVLEEINPDSTAARMGLVEVHRRAGRLPAVVDEMRDFVATRKAAWEAQPSSRQLEMQYIGAQLQLALSLLELDEVDEAVEITVPIVSEHPELPWANFVMGSCHLARDEVSDAIVALQAAATALPDEPMVQEKLAIAQAGGLRRAARTPAAPARPGTAQEAAPDRPAIPGAQASLPAPAPLDVRPSAPAEATDEADWRTLWNTANLGRLLAGHETHVQEGTAAREVLTLAALFTFNDALAGVLAAELPEANPVRAFADAVATRDPETMAQVVNAWEETSLERRVLRENAAGFMMARIGRRGSALDVLSTIGDEAPDNVVAFFNLTTMYNGLGMHRLAALTLQRILSRYPQALEARLLLFDTLMRDGRTDEARLLAETSHALYPNEPQVLLQLAEAYSTLGNLELAGMVLSAGVRDRPEDSGLRVGLALVLLREGKLGEAAALLDDVEAEGRALGALAETRAMAAAIAEDGDAMRVALNSAPLQDMGVAGWALAIAAAVEDGNTPPAFEVDDPRDATRAGALLVAAGQSADGIPADARELGERLAGNDAAFASVAAGTAYLALRLYEPAYEVLSGVRPNVSGSSFLVQQIMTALERGVEVPDRVAKARALAEAESSLTAAWLGLARVHAAVDDDAGEAAAIEQALALSPNDETVLFARATHAEAVGDIDKALDSYQRLVDGGTDSPAVFNNYAYYLVKSGGDLDRALEFAGKASELLPGNPQVRHTLGLAQLRKGMLEDARINLGAALEMMPSDPTLLLDYGDLLLQEGDEAQGRQSIELALRYAQQLGIPFDRRSEAEALLAAN